MKEFIVPEDAQGSRLDKYLQKLLPQAQKSLLQKSLRKKNITLNGKKAKPDEKIKSNDKIEIYFSDETIKKFSFREKRKQKGTLPVVEETSDYVIVNKPVGILSQPDNSGDFSVSDFASNFQNNENITFNPAPLNRLDRNTSGIIIIPKNYQTQKRFAQSIREHQANKIYHTIVKGNVTKSGRFKDSFSKNKAYNKTVLGNGSEEVVLEYKPIKSSKDYTLLEVDLKTGKSHQIRAQLAYHGFPIIGDPKYGDQETNDYFKRVYGLKNQLLHAQNYILYEDNMKLLDAIAEKPELFKKIEKNLFK